MATEEDYLSQAQTLLPKGPVWTQESDSVLTKLLCAFSTIFFAVEKRANELVKEANPKNSFEILEDWERICNLPDECAMCVDMPKTIEERRNDLVNLLTSNASPTVSYFRSVAEKIGYEIIVNELKPFVCGLSRCCDKLNGEPTVRYDVFNVFVRGKRVEFFRTGSARCGDFLGAIRYAAELECVLNKIKPAHVEFVYGYEIGE